MPYELESAPYFRKGLSTIVETVLEAKTKKPIWNFRNNIGSLVDKIKNADKVINESKYLVGENPSEIYVIVQEMIDWYTSERGGGYDLMLVSPVCQRITNIVITVLGEIPLLDYDLKEWTESQK